MQSCPGWETTMQIRSQNSNNIWEIDKQPYLLKVQISDNVTSLEEFFLRSGTYVDNGI